ncbi:antirestriction protein ArdA [Sinomonas cyclohexanicum]|uniref:Antirestriction protein ArdA n=1 Tax=Sinomonas cyclohexanicum TaxID=322009 RepID=A0ABN6FHU4_SINCY|nr:antirestriction protein ArdA [Corynebacterium cyclohexanicum]BCT76447.1 antirestriction protein ArdA [Corynebacterium cyclohexanicum]
MNHETTPSSTPERERDPDTTPAIYVASLADYVNGRLHGIWIDATIGPEAIHHEIQAMLATSKDPAPEEWAIHDYENFGPLRLSEYESIERVAAIAEHIKEKGPAFAAWLDYTGLDQEDWHYFDDAYLGEYDTLDAYTEQLIDDLGYDRLLDEALPESIRSYVKIDGHAMAQDLEASGDVFTVESDSGVYIFSSHY